MTFIKVIVSVMIILGVNILSKKNPVLGGWIAALPIVSLLSVVWLSVDQKSTSEITKFLEGVIWGLIPTAILLFGVFISLRYGLKLPFAILVGTSCWVLYTVITKRVFI